MCFPPCIEPVNLRFSQCYCWWFSSLGCEVVLLDKRLPTSWLGPLDSDDKDITILWTSELLAQQHCIMLYHTTEDLNFRVPLHPQRPHYQLTAVPAKYFWWVTVRKPNEEAHRSTANSDMASGTKELLQRWCALPLWKVRPHGWKFINILTPLHSSKYQKSVQCMHNTCHNCKNQWPIFCRELLC